VFERNQIQRTSSLIWVFQKLQRTARFHERTGKNLAVLGNILFRVSLLSAAPSHPGAFQKITMSTCNCIIMQEKNQIFLIKGFRVTTNFLSI
jgi:hypothetical protein